MGRYSFYSFEGFQLVGIGQFVAASDRAAVEVAKLKGEGKAVEIWADGRRVQVVGPQNAH